MLGYDNWLKEEQDRHYSPPVWWLECVHCGNSYHPDDIGCVENLEDEIWEYYTTNGLQPLTDQPLCLSCNEEITAEIKERLRGLAFRSLQRICEKGCSKSSPILAHAIARYRRWS